MRLCTRSHVGPVWVHIRPCAVRDATRNTAALTWTDGQRRTRRVLVSWAPRRHPSIPDFFPRPRQAPVRPTTSSTTTSSTTSSTTPDVPQSPNPRPRRPRITTLTTASCLPVLIASQFFILLSRRRPQLCGPAPIHPLPPALLDVSLSARRVFCIGHLSHVGQLSEPSRQPLHFPLPLSLREPSPRGATNHSSKGENTRPHGQITCPQTSTMVRPKRGVRFPHSNGQNSGSEGRRSSISDASEDGGASPTKVRARAQSQLAPVEEVCVSGS